MTDRILSIPKFRVGLSQHFASTIGSTKRSSKMTETYATKQAATKLNVTATTVRNWSEHYGAFLSETARPGYQPERRFTERDLTVLEYIKQLKTEGRRDAEVKQRLSETKFQDVEIIEPAPMALNVAQLSIEAQPSVQESPSNDFAALMALNDLRSEITAKFAALEQTKEETKRNRQRDTLFFALGLTAGIVLAVGLLAVAALLMGR